MLSEHALQSHIVKLLNAYGRSDIAWWAVPNGGWRDQHTARRLKQEGVRRGVSDLNFLIEGRFIAVELKADNGRISKEQEAFGQDVQRAGGFFFTAFGLDAAIGMLHGIRAFRDGISFTTPLDGRGVRERGPATKVAGRQRRKSPSPMKRSARRRQLLRASIAADGAK